MGLPSRPQTRATIPSRLRSLRTFALVCAVLVLGSLVGFADPVANPPPVAKPERQLLVKCDGGPSGEAAHAADTAVGATRVRAFHALGWHLVEIPDALSVAAAMARYRGQPGVLAVEPNAVLTTEPPMPVGEANGESGIANGGNDTEAVEPPWPTARTLHFQSAVPDSPPTPGVIPNDPRFNSQWNLRIIGMTNAWAVTTGSSNVVVAVLDSGVDYNHEDLRDNMWRNPGETGLDGFGRDKATNGIDDDVNGYVDDVYGIDAVDNDSDPMDRGSFRGTSTPFYHGSAVAGIIGASGGNSKGIAGICWSVKLMALRRSVFDQTLGTTTAYFGNTVACIDYMITMKRKGINVRVANSSGGNFIVSQSLRDAVLAMERAGILLVNSAGNNGISSDQFSQYPSSEDSAYVLSVGASTRTDALIDYSNFGPTTVDIAAPTEVPATVLNPDYVSDFSGTSSASPHVAGAAALLFSVKPDATSLDVKAALMQSVDQTPRLRGRLVSNGRLNVARALAVITNTALPPVVLGAFPGSSRSLRDAPIRVWFSRPMNRESVESSLEILPPVIGSFEWSDQDRVVTFRHQGLNVGTNYVCRLKGTAIDTHGIGIDGNFNRNGEGSPNDDFKWGFGFGPANDHFENALVLSGESGQLAETTLNASWEPDEPLAFGYPFYPVTVWYTWTAPQSGWITFETSSLGSLDTAIVAYRGDRLSELDQQGYNDDVGSILARSRISLPVIATSTYRISVAGKILISGGTVDQGSGDFTLRWYPTQRPGITSISPGTALPGATIILNGTNFTGVTRVLFNGVEARFTTLTNTHNFYDRRLTAVVPANATTGPITIETPHGNGTSAMNFEVLEGPPALLAALDPNRVLVLTWPSSATGYVLESSPALGPSSWAPVGLPIETVATRSSVRVPFDGLSRFYRLRRP